MPPEFRAAISEGTFAPRHIHALNMIALAGRMSVGELAQRLAIGVPAASQIAGELQESGWLARDRDEADRRRTWLSIAPDRRAAVEGYCQRRVEPLLKVLQSMSEETRIAFLDGLEAFASEIEMQIREG